MWFRVVVGGVGGTFSVPSYVNSEPGVVVVDDLLSGTALTGLRRLAEEGTVWHIPTVRVHVCVRALLFDAHLPNGTFCIVRMDRTAGLARRWRRASRQSPCSAWRWNCVRHCLPCSAVTNYARSGPTSACDHSHGIAHRCRSAHSTRCVCYRYDNTIVPVSNDEHTAWVARKAAETEWRRKHKHAPFDEDAALAEFPHAASDVVARPRGSSGVSLHADDAAVNVNLWISRGGASADDTAGGLVMYVAWPCARVVVAAQGVGLTRATWNAQLSQACTAGVGRRGVQQGWRCQHSRMAGRA